MLKPGIKGYLLYHTCNFLFQYTQNKNLHVEILRWHHDFNSVFLFLGNRTLIYYYTIFVWRFHGNRHTRK